MPNYVTTLCTVTGPEKAVAAFEKAYLPAFDFEKIIPQPKSILATRVGGGSGTLQELALAALTGWYDKRQRFGEPVDSLARYLDGFGILPGDVRDQKSLRAWLETNRPEALHLGELSAKALEETGHTTWYEWCIANWGTQWTTTEPTKIVERERGRLLFRFQTAWAVPVPILLKLAKEARALTFSIETVDEGGWEYAGLFRGTKQCVFHEVEASEARRKRVYGETYEES